MQEQRSSNRLLIWGCAAVTTLVVFTCCLIPIAVLAGGAILAGISESNEVTDQSTELLPVSGEDIVNLKVVNEVGTISIRGDEDAQEIEVEIISRATGLSNQRARDLLAEIKVDVRQEGNQYIVEVNDSDQDFAFFEHHSVELRITVPEELNIDVTSNVGAVSVRDVIIVSALNLTGDVGAIEFEGRISQGTHTITSNVGAVEIEVTEGSRFKLDARADVGGIDYDLGELKDENHTQETTGETLTGQYGEGDELGTLTITTNVGGITIKD